MELVAFVGNDKENWGQITALINRMEAERVVLIKNKSVEGFPEYENAVEIIVDSSKPLLEFKEDLMNKLKAKVGDLFEVGLSIASGNGKEHMAVVSALLSIPVGVRFVAYTKNGVEFLG